MGIFFTLFCVGVVFAPVIAGHLADRTGTAGAAFYLGAGLLVICVPALFAFRALPKPVR